MAKELRKIRTYSRKKIKKYWWKDSPPLAGCRSVTISTTNKYTLTFFNLLLPLVIPFCEAIVTIGQHKFIVKIGTAVALACMENVLSLGLV